MTQGTRVRKDQKSLRAYTDHTSPVWKTSNQQHTAYYVRSLIELREMSCRNGTRRCYRHHQTERKNEQALLSIPGTHPFFTPPSHTLINLPP
jgi:hypothetical protein